MAGGSTGTPHSVSPSPDGARAALNRDALDRDALDGALCVAHRAGDGSALVGLYARAADGAAGRIACAFYLTHAYVFALETGDPRAASLHARLRAMGCEH